MNRKLKFYIDSNVMSHEIRNNRMNKKEEMNNNYFIPAIEILNRAQKLFQTPLYFKNFEG